MSLDNLDLLEWAEQRRDAGIALATSHSPNWADAADAAIERIARRQPTLFTDDLKAELKGWEPHDHHCYGGVWMRAVRNRLIQRSTETCKSRDPIKNAHRYAIYFSLVYRP